MFDYLCYHPMDSYAPEEKEAPPMSYLRLLNLSYGCRTADVYLNNHLVAKKFGFKRYTPYFAVPAGQHTADIFQAGKKDTPKGTLDISLKPNLIYTFVIEGAAGNRPLLVHDPAMEAKKGQACLRFIHVYPGLSSLDITLPDRTKLLQHVSYRCIQDYMAIAPGRHNFLVYQDGAAKPALSISNIDIKEEWNYTIYLGASGKSQGFIAVNLIDGSTYIKK